MINTITINNVTSYKEPTSLKTDKKINLIYGLNGSGKTTISDYLKELGDSDFNDCTIEGFDQERQKILVYNQNFVHEIFYEEYTQKGIFTVAKENKDALQNIEIAKQEKGRLSNTHIETNRYLADKNDKIQEVIEKAQQKTWEIKKTYTGGDRVFDKAGFLDGLKGKKEKLFEYINRIPLKDSTKTIEEIKTELQNIGENATSRDEVSPLDFIPLAEIENNTIFQKEIIGSPNSTVASVIERLGNSDWVKKGIVYLDASDTCPFCQQQTATAELQKEIKDYFDEAYEKEIKALQLLEQSYQQFKNNFNSENYNRDFFEESEISKLNSLFNDLEKILAKNLHQMERKVKSPSQKITLNSSKEAILKINGFITNQNQKIKDFNTKLANMQQTIQGLEKEFWQILRKKYDSTIVSYNEENIKLNDEKKEIAKELTELQKNIKVQDSIIKENQKKITNVEQTIDAINQHLHSFGISDFEIVKHQEDLYRIKRKNGQEEDVFISLSEGEKTVISFLYFVELCKGEAKQDETKEKIIVVDDPISSLSHMYIFNVAELIRSTFITPMINSQGTDFIQCFILTHSLYFFHEVQKACKGRDFKFFRVAKERGTSTIKTMGRNEIKNDYEAYWNVIKTDSPENMTLVANAMRNIIEHFFGFIEKNDKQATFGKEDFKDNKFQSFKRYMDRESHSDPINLSDYNEFDLNIFKEAFEKMFEVTGYIEHYNKYMGKELP